jgi:hypothetical protein
MNKDDLIKDFLKSFKPKEEQSWKSSYFFTHYLKNNHDIDAMLVEGMSRIKKLITGWYLWIMKILIFML